MTRPEALFFYGTLRHRPLLDLVLGPAGAARVRLTPAGLPGHAARWVAGECFPMIRTEEGAVAEGLVAEGLLPEDVARLEFYEGGHLYGLVPVTVETPDGPRPARVFFPEEGAWEAGDRFDLAHWVARWGAITMRAAADYMDGYGRFSGGEMARRFARQRARAWSRVMAEETASPSEVRTGPGRDAVHLRRRRRRHDGFFALDEVALSHPTFGGGRLDVLREVFIGTDAALVLPYDPATDRVALIEQFRAGPLLRGDARPWMLEPVAGLVDPGETPEDCARREAVEETGLVLRRLVPVPGGYPSPGATTEFYHLFVGLCDLAPGHEGPGGLDAEGEDIRTHVLDLDEALRLTGTGEANVLPLSLLLFWTALNRASLRSLA
jgi:nudix-type nucleoside diphosphatase (YffH/AdpP family)